MTPAIQSALNGIIGSAAALQAASGAGRAFELFVMTSIARGLQSAGFEVWLQRSDGTMILPRDSDRRFIQRGGAPTGIAPASAGSGNASVIGFEWRGRGAWEIWNGIQFEGRSGASHEIDIAIVPGAVGQALRRSGGRPFGRPRVAIECKDVGTDGSLDEMRAFVARLYDITLLNAHHRYLPFTNVRCIHPGSSGIPQHGAVLTYKQENERTGNCIARRSGFTKGASPLARYYRVEPHAQVSVGSPGIVTLVDAVVRWAMHRAR